MNHQRAMDALNSVVNGVESLNVATSDSTSDNGHRQQRRKKQENHKATGAGERNRSLEVRTKIQHQTSYWS